MSSQDAPANTKSCHAGGRLVKTYSRALFYGGLLYRGDSFLPRRLFTADSPLVFSPTDFRFSSRPSLPLFPFSFFPFFVRRLLPGARVSGTAAIAGPRFRDGHAHWRRAFCRSLLRPVAARQRAVPTVAPRPWSHRPPLRRAHVPSSPTLSASLVPFQASLPFPAFPIQPASDNPS
jgi:hypothetical protein